MSTAVPCPQRHRTRSGFVLTAIAFDKVNEGEAKLMHRFTFAIHALPHQVESHQSAH
jgi:hypothetical protein